MEKTMAFWTIEISAKLKDKAEGVEYANRLIIRLVRYVDLIVIIMHKLWLVLVN